MRSYTLEDLKTRLSEIKEMGFIQSKREGNTGIGYTLEELLEVKENNLAIADYGQFELKTSRIGTNTLITLFSKSPKRYIKGNWGDIIKKYGYNDSKNRLALQFTMEHTKENTKGFYYLVQEDPEELVVIYYKEEKIAYFSESMIITPLRAKLQNLVFVKTKRNKGKLGEKFHFFDAFLFKDPSLGPFLKCLEESKVTIDFRMYLKEGKKVRDRGTVFRIKEHFLENLYNKKIDLVI